MAGSKYYESRYGIRPIRRKIKEIESGLINNYSIKLDCGHRVNYFTYGKPPQKAMICEDCTREASIK